MSVVRLRRFLLLPAAFTAAMVLLRFAAILLQQAFHKGFGEGLMAAWILLFVLGVPLLLLAAAAAHMAGAQAPRPSIVPSLGVKIP